LGFTTNAQLKIKNNGSAGVGLNGYEPLIDEDFIVMNVHSDDYESSYTAFRMDDVNNYLILNNSNSYYKNEIQWKQNNLHYWSMGMPDRDNVSIQTPQTFFIGGDVGGSNPLIWLVKDSHTNDRMGILTADPQPGFSLTVEGDAYCRGGRWEISDKRFKSNITTITGVLDKISEIRGITYKKNKKDSSKDNEINNNSKTSLLENDSIDNFPIDTTNYNPLPENRYGVVAQELQKQFPDLVYEGSDGYLAVNYKGLIPILIEAIKEQNEANIKRQIQLDTAKNQLIKHVQQISILNQLVQNQQQLIDQLTEEIKLIKGQCCAKTENNTKQQSTGNNKGGREDGSQEPPRLYQNTPNPFSENTEIRYYLTEATTTAILYIYNMQGRQVDSYPVYQFGHGSITIEGGLLDPGMYMYTLVADGQEVDTKKMILTR
jgi:hypothetical protein